MYQRVSPEQAYELLQSGEWTALDVRSAEEYKASHVDGAISLPLQTIVGIDNFFPNTDAKLIVYCHSGARSARAAYFLEDNGYNNVLDLGSIISYYKYLHAR